MFTGLVETKGRVAASEAGAFGRRLTVDVGGWRGRGDALTVGDSIAVQGVCLTVAALEDGKIAFDVVAETLSATKLGGLQVGDAVNLESSLTAHTAMGGHFVQGHVDGVGDVSSVRRDEHEHLITITPPASLMDYLPPKGSVTVEGVSLTIAAVRDDAFDIALIPTTLHETTLGELEQDDRVNIETDMLSRAVVHWLRRQQQGGDAGAGGVNWETLRHAGFVNY